MFTQAVKGHDALLDVPYLSSHKLDLQKKQVVFLILFGKSMAQFSQIKQKKQCFIVFQTPIIGSGD